MCKSSSYIHELPLEIVHEICFHLPLEDKKSFRLTCTTLNRQLAGKVLETIKISLSRPLVIVEIIETLTEYRPHPASEGTTGLVIGPPLRTTTSSPTLPKTKSLTLQREELQRTARAIAGIFEQMRSLKLVEWTPLASDPTLLLHATLRALCALEHLENLRVDLSRIPAGTTSGLRPEEVTFPDCDALNFIVGPTSSELERSGEDASDALVAPKLKWIAALVDGGQPQTFGLAGKQDTNISLEQILPNGVERKLERMRLRNVYVRDVGTIWEAFQNLTSLRLSNVNGCLPWKALQKSGVHLVVLESSMIHEDMLPYIASYCGISKLDVQAKGLLAHMPSAANQFWTGLERHKKTLLSLRLHAQVPTWCLDEEKAKKISSFDKLERLNVPLDIETASESMATLVNHVANGSTNLTALSLSVVPVLKESTWSSEAVQETIVTKLMDHPATIDVSSEPSIGTVEVEGLGLSQPVVLGVKHFRPPKVKQRSALSQSKKAASRSKRLASSNEGSTQIKSPTRRNMRPRRSEGGSGSTA